MFQSLGYEICLTSDFNGRCLSKCEFTNKTILTEVKQSYNGVRLRQFTEAANLIIANSLDCCKGFFTRILNDQKSAIDNVLFSENLCRYVKSVDIDESGNYFSNSDHVIVWSFVWVRPKRSQSIKIIILHVLYGKLMM